MTKSSLTEKTLKATLDECGWVLLPAQVLPELISQLQPALEHAERVCRAHQEKKGLANTAGTVHHLPVIDPVFLTLLNSLPGESLIQAFFASPFILNSYGGVLNPSGNQAYVGNVHRDIRLFSGELPLMMNLLVMLDDFTLENGATYVLSGSHQLPDNPSDETFFAKAEQVTGRAGDCLLFNSNLWHAAGINHSDSPRRALTLTFTKPMLKPQLDYGRALGEDCVAALSPVVQQLIGQNARIPASLEEWYQPPESRFYRPGQDV